MVQIGVVVLGASGYMATQGLSALTAIKERLRDDGIDVKLVSLVDPMLYSRIENVTPRARLRAYQFMRGLNECGFDETAALVIDDIVERRMLGGDIPEKLLFYDATKTSLHIDHLYLLYDFKDIGLFYFGEKPIFTDIVGMETLVDTFDATYTYFCDFIETENPVVRVVREFIQESGIEVDQLDFWRSGSSGLKHIVGHNQSGVEGGAWLDKAPHDLSIAVSLMGNDPIIEFEIANAWIRELIPTVASSNGEIQFLPAYGFDCHLPADEINFDVRTAAGARASLPADGKTEAIFSLQTLSGRNVGLTVLAGWTGYHGYHDRSAECQSEAMFTKKLDELGISQSDWLFSERFDGMKDGTEASCIESQARIMFVEGQIGDVRHRIVGSLIHCDADVDLGRDALARWARVYREVAGKWEFVQQLTFRIAETYAEQKVADLGFVFEKVIKHVARDHREEIDISTKSVNMVHRMLLSAHDTAIQSAIGDKDLLGEKAMIALQNIQKMIVRA